jgi:hypothetical protein
MAYEDKGEVTREHYRKQGEARLLALLTEELTKLKDEKPNAAWSATYLINLIGSIYENRNSPDQRTNA